MLDSLLWYLTVAVLGLATLLWWLLYYGWLLVIAAFVVLVLLAIKEAIEHTLNL